MCLNGTFDHISTVSNRCRRIISQGGIGGPENWREVGDDTFPESFLNTAADGSELKSKFDVLEAALTTKYGEPARVDFLRSGKRKRLGMLNCRKRWSS